MTDNELNQQLQKARVLIDTGNYDKQNRAKVLLNEIIQQASGSQSAVEARCLLTESPAGRCVAPRPLEDTKIATELQTQWASIHSLRHAQLTSFIEKVFAVTLSAGHTLSRLRKEVIQKLENWMNELLMEAEPSTRDRMNEPVIEWVNAIHNHPDFQQALQPALDKWQMAMFTQQFEKVATKIREVLRNWEVDQAQSWLTEICQGKNWPPALDLQHEIDEVRETKTRLETLWEEIPKPDNWSQIAILLERQQKLVPFLTTPAEPLQVVNSVPNIQYPPPLAWQVNIADRWQQRQTQLKNFLQQRAEACQTLAAVREFYQQFDQIGALVVALWPAYEPDSNWFKPAWETYQTDHDKQLLTVSSVAQLKQLHDNVLVETNGLPEWLAIKLQKRAKDISRLIASWEAMVTGAYVMETRPLEASLVPTALALAIQQHQTLLQQFEEAIQHWDIDKFLHLYTQAQATQSTMPGYYGTLVKHSDTLKELAFLATRPPFNGFQQAATWWKQWQLTEADLPPQALEQLPSFTEQLTQIAAIRQQQWFALLDQKLAEDSLTHSECQDIAISLEIWQDTNMSLRKYFQDFHRRACYLFAKEQITMRQWQPAKEALTEFVELGGARAQFDQLSLVLELKQAEVEAPANLADLLWQQWFLVVDTLHGQQICELLEIAIQHSWQIQEDGKLSKLLELSQRLPVTQRSETLKVWINWLTIESNLAKEMTSTDLLNLVKLVFTQEGRQIRDSLRQPVQRLVKQWQQSPDQQFLFAWFYHASQQVQPPLFREATDPLEQLSNKSIQQVKQIEDSLRSSVDFEETEWVAMQNRIRTEQDQWQRLQGYFDLLPFSIPRPSIQPVGQLRSLNLLIDKLAQVKSDLAKLEDADLREDKYQSQLLGVRHLLIKHLKGFAVETPWRNRLERLERLKGVNFPFSQFKKAALSFGQEDIDYFSSKLTDMQKYVSDLIQQFEQTGFVGRGLWQQLSKDCWQLACKEGGIFLPMPDSPDLRALREALTTLVQEEKQFVQQLAELYQEALKTRVASGSVGLDVSQSRYQPFFATFPEKAPTTRKCDRFFDQAIHQEPQATLLKQKQSINCVPSWAKDKVSLLK